MLRCLPCCCNTPLADSHCTCQCHDKENHVLCLLDHDVTRTTMLMCGKGQRLTCIFVLQDETCCFSFLWRATPPTRLDPTILAPTCGCPGIARAVHVAVRVPPLPQHGVSQRLQLEASIAPQDETFFPQHPTHAKARHHCDISGHTRSG